jgi:uncharacterized membrane protein (UPF0127 family)
MAAFQTGRLSLPILWSTLLLGGLLLAGSQLGAQEVKTPELKPIELDALPPLQESPATPPAAVPPGEERQPAPSKTAVPSRNTPPTPAPVKKLPRVEALLNGERFQLEVAVSLADQLQGLMFRESLAPKHGMLFQFSPPRAVNFWMKNCKISLDMVFVRNGVVVHVVESATPCKKDPCPVYPSIFSVDTVVELPAGSARQFAIQPGDRLQLVSASEKPTVPVATPQAPPATPAPAAPATRL